MVQFRKAVKSAAKLRLELTGPAGSGKTYTALRVATELAAIPAINKGRNGRIAFLDSEHGSASKYAHLFDFDAIGLPAEDPKEMPKPGFHPDNYVAIIKTASDAGYSVLIIDSLTHAWDGDGGLLYVVEQIAKLRYQNNTFRAWAEGTPIQNRLIEAMLATPLHLIATARTKNDTVMDPTATGKMQPRKVGLTAKQREGLEYEFDVACMLTHDNELMVEKTRCPALSGRVFHQAGKDFAIILADWLREEVPTPETLPAHPTPPADEVEMVVEPVTIPADYASEIPETPAYDALTDAVVKRAMKDALGVANLDDYKQWLASFQEDFAKRGITWNQATLLSAIENRKRKDDETRAKQQARQGAKAAKDGHSLEGLPVNGKS